MFLMASLSGDQSMGLKPKLQLGMGLLRPSMASCELWDWDGVGAFVVIDFKSLLAMYQAPSSS